MTVRLHAHAMQRLKERGATRDEVVYTVKHGKRSPAKFDRTHFTHLFAFNRKWQGVLYSSKTIEAFAVEEKPDDWLVITVVVKFSGRASR